MMGQLKNGVIVWAAVAALFVVLSPAGFAEGGKKGSLQDFESDNGTDGEYYTQIWNCVVDFENKKVRGGNRSIKLDAADKGGTVGIRPAHAPVDLSKAKKISIWVYDTQGENTVELRLKDANGNGGSGIDGKSMWSSEKSKQNAWTKIEWDLKQYPDVDGLDKSKITSVEICEQQQGTYYFDDLEFD